MKVYNIDRCKFVRSEDYNFNFNMDTGFFARWGKEEVDDPEMSPFGSEIADIEISTICNQGCKFCYKANTPNGKNMSFDTFKRILDNMLRGQNVLTQIAFGSGATGEENPDTWKIMEYCREHGIIPNITVANITDETADKLAKYCGAVAVSRYDNKDMCYDSIKKLTDRGMKQVNIHQLICAETIYDAYQTIRDMKYDPRLEKMNAIVFLSLKKKGRGKTGFTPLTQEQFTVLVYSCISEGISFGMDSCGAHKCSNAIRDMKDVDVEKLEQMIEPCESSLFSIYINVDGEVFPCSFVEGTKGWETGIDAVDCIDFQKDIWYNSRLIGFRNKLLKNCRNCPVFEV